MADSLLLDVPVFHFRRLADEIPAWRIDTRTQLELKSDLSRVLNHLSIDFDCDVADGPDRYDFLCNGGIVIEAKLGNTFIHSLRQAERYCQSERVTCVVIVAARNWAASMHGELKLHGKPVRVVRITGGLK